MKEQVCFPDLPNTDQSAFSITLQFAISADQCHLRRPQALGLPDGPRTGRRSPSPPPALMLDLYNSVTDGRGRWRGPAPYGASVVRSLPETGQSAESRGGDLRFHDKISKRNVEWPFNVE